MGKEKMPAWLQTLWNVNPGLAEKAEKYVERWQDIESDMNNLGIRILKKS